MSSVDTAMPPAGTATAPAVPRLEERSALHALGWAAALPLRLIDAPMRGVQKLIGERGMPYVFLLPRPWENGFAVACSQMNFTDGT